MNIHPVMPSYSTTPLPVTPAVQSSPSSSSSIDSASDSSSSLGSADISTEQFISILSAELQAQDPTQPVDPTTFLSQLAQFNSLDELTAIRQDIESGATLGSSQYSSNGSASAPSGTFVSPTARPPANAVALNVNSNQN
jgi:flagellar basal-body rod modification protein FlgD